MEQDEKHLIKEREKLKVRTERLWGQRKENEQTYISDYIKILLPKELEFIRKVGKQPEPKGGTLVLLVGYSFEPLIISVCMWKPERIILVMNKLYGSETGKSRYEDLKILLEKLKELQPREKLNYDIVALEKLGTLDGDQPHDVFKFLRDKVQGENNLTIDITGGKKSMVAGAFLYGAYSNASIAYVDFDEYNAENQRPYGYTCKVSALDNPYDKFALRDWEEIRNLYEKYSFSSALQLLKSIKKSVTEYFDDQQKDSIEIFERLLTMYKAWDNSNFAEAKIIAKHIEDLRVEEAPSICKILEDEWRWPIDDPASLFNCSLDEINQIGDSAIEVITNRPELIYIYARDELERASRLVNIYEDYRSALIRAAAVSELLVNSRLELAKDFLTITNNVKFGDFRKFASFSKKMRLLKSGFVTIPSPEGRYKVKLNIKNLKHFSKMKQHLSDLKNQLENISKLAAIRNSVVHGCLQVTKNLAVNGLIIALENVQEFERYIPYPVENQKYDAVDWKRVKEICKLNFLPEVPKK